MKKMSISMTILMSITLSAALSIVGNLLSGHFSLTNWLLSFGISLILSLILGFFVPITKACNGFCKLCGIKPSSFSGNLVSSILTDLIYTPIITTAMVFFMVRNAITHMPAGVPEADYPSVARLLPGSLGICFGVGLIIILIARPLFSKLLIKTGVDD